jgi:hypothetical protein
MTDSTEPKDKRIALVMTASELKAVDDWSFERRIRSRGEAIRQLLALGIKASTEEEKQAEKPAKPKKGKGAE